MPTIKTPEIPLSSIELGSRYRDDYGDIDQLCHSITKNGLITPVAVGVADKVTMPRQTDLPYILLAGGRRIKALTALGWKNIPVRIYDQPISLLDLRSIELAENFDRKEMSYAEELALLNEINTLQTQIHGEKVTRDKDAPGWSQADTARLISKSPASVTKDLQLARAIQTHPELQLDKCKNKSEAFKRLKNVSKSLTNEAAAAKYTATVSDKVVQKLTKSYIIKDCLEVFKQIPDSAMNFIEIDPPYAIALGANKANNECLGYNEIPASEYTALMSSVLKESYRTLKEGSWLICWFGISPWYQIMAEMIRDAGFKLQGIPAIWTNLNGQTMQPERTLGNCYETFFYARKGEAKLQKPGRSNVYQYKQVPPSQKYHPTQKPLDMMVDIYETFSSPGANGYIPFAGSGVGLLAGHMNKMNMIASDLTPSFKDGYVLELQTKFGD